MTTHEIYLLHTNAKGEKSTSSHFVWDSSRFLGARQADANKEGTKVEQITAAQYREARKPQK